MAGPVLWRLNLSATDVDGDGRRLYGLGGRRHSAGVPEYYREERIAGGCPTGGDSARFVFTGYDGQRYVGGGVATPAPEWGEARITRGKIKYHMGRRDAAHAEAGDHRRLGRRQPPDPDDRHAPRRAGAPHHGPPDRWRGAHADGQRQAAGHREGLTFTDRQRQVHGEVGLGYYMNDPVAPNDDF